MIVQSAVVCAENRTLEGNHMELRELSAKQMTEVYNQYMVIDFPQDELKPLERILHTMKTGLSCAYGIYEEDELRGYAVLVVPDGLRYGLLDYLAVIKEYRGAGIGHIFFELVGDTLSARYPALRGFLIESEDIAFAANDKERQIRERRIAFYQQNHCAMTTFGSRLFGVDYSILVYDFDKREDAKVTLEDLDSVYLAMFPKHHYENNVSLWEV